MIAAIGRKVNADLKEFAYAAGFFFQVLKGSLTFFKREQIGFKVLTMQILFTGIEAFSIVILIGIALGAVIIIEGFSILPQLGQGAVIYHLLIIIITRELGPVLTAFIIIARSSTAIATELGNMVISHQIEALVSMGINPISYLAVPRFIGVTISTVILNVYFNISGLIGSFFVTQLFFPLQVNEYFRNLLMVMKGSDILSSLVKSIVFGIIISTVATYNGFKVQQASTEIPQVAIRSVGQGFIFCILADAIITMIYYL